MSIQAKHIEQDTVLYLNGVSVSFDGFKALNSLSLFIEPGEMRAIIGPNGAGKTTMMDVITGKTKPDEGTILFKDTVDLTKYEAIASDRERDFRPGHTHRRSYQSW